MHASVSSLPSPKQVLSDSLGCNLNSVWPDAGTKGLWWWLHLSEQREDWHGLCGLSKYRCHHGTAARPSTHPAPVQRSLGCYLAGPNATVPPLVADLPRTVDSKVCLACPDVRLVQIDICTMSCQHFSLHDCNGSLVGLKAMKPVTQCQATPAFIPQWSVRCRRSHVSGVGIKWARHCTTTALWVFQGGSDAFCWQRWQLPLYSDRVSTHHCLNCTPLIERPLKRCSTAMMAWSHQAILADFVHLPPATSWASLQHHGSAWHPCTVPCASWVELNSGHH